MSGRKKGSVRLTKVTAKKVIGRIARRTEVEDRSNRAVGADIYEASVDGLDLIIRCENDWFAQNGRINLIISDRWGGGHITLCFDPETMERDPAEEEALREREAREE